MDEGYDRSPVDKRDDYSRDRDSRPAPSRRRDSPPPSGPRGRSRSRSPPARRFADGDRDRFRGGYGGGRGGPPSRRRSRSRSPPPRRDRDDRGPSRRQYDDDRQYPHSATRGGHSSSYAGRNPSFRGGARGGGGAGGRPEPERDFGGREALAQEAIKTSKKENRVYIGNLAFSVRWQDLKDFCGSVGPIAFVEIIQLPNGMSKGCGIVEFQNHDDAVRAISELNEQQLMGRPVYLREDRESEARFGSAAVSSRSSFPGASFQIERDAPRGRGPPPGSVPAVFAPPGPRGLFIQGMLPNIGWQDLKDLFRAAGEVVRADVNMDHTTGVSKGTGTVVMSSKSEADAAIAMFNGYEFDGGRLDVREDRFFHINSARGGFGGSRGGRGGGDSGRGGYRGGPDSGRSTDNLYGDYGASRGESYRDSGYGGGRDDDRGARPPRAPRSGPPPPDAHLPFEAPPSTQIFVKNLPWSTSNEDLVELFQTTGTVQEAEIIWENGRSRGSGVVQFATIEEAEGAIAKFQNYQYGGRPLGLNFNARWKEFNGPTAAHTDGVVLHDGDDSGYRNGNGSGMASDVDAAPIPAEEPATDGMLEEPATEGM